MNLAKYHITITPPPYNGSTSRGGFGHALRRVICTIIGEAYTSCKLRSTCIHPYSFETTSPKDEKSEDSPRPFIIEPSPCEKRHYSRDDKLDIQLICIGGAINYAPYFIFVSGGLGRLGMERSGAVDVMNIGCGKETLIHDSGSYIRDSQQMIDRHDL